LKEISERGIAFKPGEFIDFVQDVVVKEKTKTLFVNGRPSYDWYSAFMARNSHIVEIRQETALESRRAKTTKESSIDSWYSTYRDFEIRLSLIDKPNRIYNADESGFSLRSKPGKVIGPKRNEVPQVSHVTGGSTKERLTVMFCGAADGSMIPPFFVYPSPRPRGYTPLTGAMANSGITYTAKFWMDTVTFKSLMEHFDNHCVQERPVILLIESVGCHVNMSVFQFAMSRGIELYMFIANATHIMQPLDVGVFGPLKIRWYKVLCRQSRENPGSPVGKEKFPALLKEAFLLLYRSLTVVNSFISSGIYPVDSNAVRSEVLKPGLTFSGESSSESSKEETEKPSQMQSSTDCLGALKVLESALDTPVRTKNRTRIEEGYDIESQSPCFQVYKRLHTKSMEQTKVNPSTATATFSRCPDSPEPESDQPEQDTRLDKVQVQAPRGLDLLATVCPGSVEQPQAITPSIPTETESVLSPVLAAKLVFPKAAVSTKRKASVLYKKCQTT